jgi:type IV secretory pathway TrbL component
MLYFPLFAHILISIHWLGNIVYTKYSGLGAGYSVTYFETVICHPEH